jgi:hypothetical protein
VLHDVKIDLTRRHAAAVKHDTKNYMDLRSAMWVECNIPLVVSSPYNPMLSPFVFSELARPRVPWTLFCCLLVRLRGRSLGP